MTCTLTNEISYPSKIQGRLLTVSGTGSEHKVVLSSETTGKKQTQVLDFQLDQNFVFEGVNEGTERVVVKNLITINKPWNCVELEQIKVPRGKIPTRAAMFNVI